MAPEIRFAPSRSAGNIAYTTEGSGPPLVVLPPWTSHLVVQAGLSGHDRFCAALARQHTVVLYDRWGTGLSDRDRTDFRIDADVEVLADLADHLKLRRFAIFAPSQGAPVGVGFAHRWPRRVSHLMLYGPELATPERLRTWTALRDLITANWPVAARSMAALVARGGAPTDIDTFTDLLMAAATPDMTVALRDAALQYDSYALLDTLQTRLLVLQRRGDGLVAHDAGSSIASRVADAQLAVLDGDAHVHTTGDVEALAARVLAFTGGAARRPSAQLSDREAEVLELAATGRTNAEIAERLVLSIRTVERHLLNSYAKLGVRSRTEAAARWTAEAPATPARNT